MTEPYEANKKRSRQKVLELKAYKYSDKSQHIYLMKGMPVIARITTADCSINDQFTVQKMAADVIILTDGHATMEIETTDFTRLFNIIYCITCHAAQGSTFDHPYTIHQFDMMDARLRSVSISRSTKKEYINTI